MRLKELRKKLNLTQSEVADKLLISRMNYNRYELGKVEPDIATLISLAKFFDVSVDFLIENDNTFKLDLSNIPDIKKENIKDILKLSEKNDYILKGYLIKMLDDQNN